MATVTIGGRSYEVEVRGDTVVVDGQEFPVKIARGDAYDTVTAGGVSYRVALPPEGERESGMAIEVDHRPFTLAFEGRLGGGPARPRGEGVERGCQCSGGCRERSGRHRGPAIG